MVQAAEVTVWEEVKQADVIKVAVGREVEDLKKESKLNNERRRLENAVKKLTLDPKEKVDHHIELGKSAELLNATRNKSDSSGIETVDFVALKSNLLSTKNTQEILKSLKLCPQIQVQLADLEQSKLLEQLLKISTLEDNPLTDFPLNINKNHYSQIVNFAFQHAPDVLSLIVKLTTKNEAPINEIDIVRIAQMFSSLASSVSGKNNALKKTKSVSTKNNGTTNAGLDMLAHAGLTETSRSVRNDRDLLASLADEILRSYARYAVPMITFDNMDICIANVMHHMTLPFLEFETIDTSHLSVEEESFEEALDYFDMKTVNIMSDFNKQLFIHYKYVAACILGRLFGKEVEGFSWFLQIFPKHHQHPNKANAANKSNIFTQKPLNYSENSNSDMIKIMETLQWQYLNLVGEQCKDKDQFRRDLQSIYSVDIEESIRLDAEERVKQLVIEKGELVLVCHGDLLTEVRFESCKRLRRMCITAVERFDFMRIFRLGTFHLHMNKVIQDITAGMKSEVNVDEPLSLGYFKTILGLNHISNQPDYIKRDGNFEVHSQFCEDVGTELLIEAFKTFAKKSGCPSIQTEKAAVDFILNFLDKADIKFYYDPDNNEECAVFDDMLSAAKESFPN